VSADSLAYEEILAFWFGDRLRDRPSFEDIESRAAVWFGSSPDFDDAIRSRYAELPGRALRGELDSWSAEPCGVVALVIVLDQFPRNLYRRDPRAFACDARALALACAFVDDGSDQQVSPIEATFVYLPLEHAEDRVMQARCVALCDALAQRADDALRVHFERFADYARRHQQVIARFGRFPHRNSVLGRESTPDEFAYLDSGGETFG
jgi:uncharacterized protein (DUF924 family)